MGKGGGGRGGRQISATFIVFILIKQSLGLILLILFLKGSDKTGLICHFQKKVPGGVVGLVVGLAIS